MAGLTAAGDTDSFEMGVTYVPELGGNIPYLHPNESKTYEFYVENQGGLMDSYILELTVENPTWEGWLDRYRLDDVPPDERRTFNMTIKAPAQASAGDRTNVSLVARSELSNISETIQFIAWVIVEKAVTLTCPEPTLATQEGGTVRFRLNVTNIGDVRDEYKINCTLVPEGEGWTVVVENGSMDLNAGQSTSLTVTLTAPHTARANDNGTVFVRVQSLTDRSVWDGKKLVCNIIERSLSATLLPGPQDLRVLPGSTTTAELVLQQRTNDGDPQRWRVAVHFTADGWAVSVPDDPLEVVGDVNKSIVIRVDAPERAIGGERLDVLVTVVLNRSVDYVLETNLSFVVVEYSHFWVSGPPGNLQVDPRGWTPFVLTLGSTGNVGEMLEVIVDEAYAWSIDPSDSTYVDGFLLLPPWSTATLSMGLKVPETALAGGRVVDITVSSDHGQVVVYPLFVDILEVRALELQVDGPVPLEVEPGPEGVTVGLDLHNTGNVPLLLHMGFVWPSRQLEAQLDDVVVALVADGATRVNLTVWARRDEPFGDYEIQVRAVSTDSAFSEVYGIPIYVAGPDLTIVDVVVWQGPKTGVPTPLNVSVSNVGRAVSGPCELVVVDDAGAVIAGPVAVGALDAGATVQVGLELVPRVGRRTYSATVTPINGTHEDGKAPNTRAFFVDAWLSDEDGQGNDLPPTFALWAGLAVVVALLVALRVRARKHRSREQR